MWELDHEEGCALKNWCFQIVMLIKTLESSLDCKKIKPVDPKGNQSWIFIGRTDAEAEAPDALATWCEELTYWKRTWCWERLKAGGEEGDRGWDGLEHTRLPCPLLSPRVCSNAYPLCGWLPCNHLILCHPLLLLPSIFPSIRVFSSESVLWIRWPKYWSFSFSISPSNEYSGLISFRIDWFDLPAVQGILESSPAPQFKSINSLALRLFYGPTVTAIHDCWKNHNSEYMQSRFIIAFLPRS